MKAQLSLKDLRYTVRLGTTEQERSTPQPVAIDVVWIGPPPLACQTDALSDTQCYFELTQCIQAVCQTQSFHLIEHLTFLLFQQIKQQLPDTYQVTVRVTKCSPPIEALKGGATFELSDGGRT